VPGGDAPDGTVRPFRGIPAKPDPGMKPKATRNCCDPDPQPASAPDAIRV
jgi:hypothetical protein